MDWNAGRPKAETPEFEQAQELVKRIAKSNDPFERKQLAEGLPQAWREIPAVREWISPELIENEKLGGENNEEREAGTRLFKAVMERDEGNQLFNYVTIEKHGLEGLEDGMRKSYGDVDGFQECDQATILATARKVFQSRLNACGR